MPNVRKEVLSNGLTVLTESMSSVRSVAVGIWLRTGARQESAEDNGISHFIEHMLFKGTKHRSAEAGLPAPPTRLAATLMLLPPRRPPASLFHQGSG